jgi:hypothetical protein
MDVMDLQKIIGQTLDVFSAKRVFSEPYERDGVTILPAASVIGGGGGGGDAEATGTGYGVLARPIGAYVIRDGEVEWRPAIDRTALIVTTGVVAIAAIRLARAFAERG